MLIMLNGSSDMQTGTDTYRIDNAGGTINGCIDLCFSPDDGGWYAQQYDFKRSDNATRTSKQIFHTREALVLALDSSAHRWNKWD